ncbi:MAG: hypothetical protein CG439_2447, partial [Methylococcaceae bacterium NSP1-2]
LPDGDTDYSMRWGFIKKEFTKAWLLADGIEQPRSLVGYAVRTLFMNIRYTVDLTTFLVRTAYPTLCVPYSRTSATL